MVCRRASGGEDEQPSHRGRLRQGDSDLQRERCVTSRAVSYNSSEDKELEMRDEMKLINTLLVSTYIGFWIILPYL